MPYIKDHKRFALEAGARLPETPGELNFLLTTNILNYCDERPIDYATYNEVLGVLEACKLEFYRRKLVPYEEAKIILNGDVYA